LYGVTPDLTCLGKILGGGMPVGAYCGPATLMRHVAPDGPVYQAGTLAGSPLAMAAGLATLRVLQADPPYARLDRLAGDLATGLAEAADRADVPYAANRAGSVLSLFFTGARVTDYASVKTADTGRYARFFHGMLSHGVAFAPAQFEAAFVSTAHTEAHIRETVALARDVLATLGAGAG